MSAARRLLSISAATATIATLGLVAFSTPAHAAPASSQVWVCKYVGTPGVDERLQTGNNPIRVSGNAADEDNDGQVFVGEQFADAQGRSVIVQIEGEDPGAGVCSPTPPPEPGMDLRRATAHRIRVAREATSPSAWSGAGHCSSEPPSWRPRRNGVAGRPPIGDVDACGRPAQGSPRTPVGDADRAAARPVAPRRRARPTVGPCARQKRPRVTARPVDGPGSHARSGSCARSPWCSASLASSWS